MRLTVRFHLAKVMPHSGGIVRAHRHWRVINSGGMWTFDPAGRQIITTSGHTMDDAYQDNGGSGTASWTLQTGTISTSCSGCPTNATTGQR